MEQLNPLQWAILPLKKYATFSGRAPRAEYWWYRLGAGIVGFLLGVFDFLVLHGPVYGNYGILGLLFVIVCAVPGIAVLVRRLHDTGRSGWWASIGLPTYALLIVGRSPFSAGALVDGASTPVLVVFGLLLLMWIVAAIGVFIFVVTAGDVGSNQYGPDPYGASELEEVFA
jgi:uncharacterized membrane protein YhaH (DUF805 family)